MFVKICGITNIEDAEYADNLGANALGFIFAKSKRQISSQIAASIVKQLASGVEKVGVFVNEETQTIFNIAQHVGLTCIQLHGNESQQQCDEISEYYKVIKAVKVDQSGQVVSSKDYQVWKILLDTYLPQIEGGSGKTFDWTILQNFQPENVIVAGGLNPENIGILLSNYKPFGVDLSSGVEAYPGKKDHQKLAEFFDNLKNVNSK